MGQFSLIDCDFQPIESIVEDGDNENEISLEEIKKSVGWGSQKEDDDVSSVADEVDVKPVAPVLSTNLQQAFQPSSTPIHLQQRFMVKINNKKAPKFKTNAKVREKKITIANLIDTKIAQIDKISRQKIQKGKTLWTDNAAAMIRK